MSQMIHARKTKDGQFRFRVWSTNTDSYISEEMTETDVRVWLLQEDVRYAIEQHLREIDSRIQRTCARGTSQVLGDTRELNAPWDRGRR